MRYEIIGYETNEDFKNDKHFVINEHCSSKKEALKIGDELLSRGKFEKIKIQGEDKKWIRIIDNNKKPPTIEEDIQNWLKSK